MDQEIAPSNQEQIDSNNEQEEQMDMVKSIPHEENLESDIVVPSVVVDPNQIPQLVHSSSTSNNTNHNMQQSTIIQQRAQLLLQQSIINEDPVENIQESEAVGKPDDEFYTEDYFDKREIPYTPIHPDTIKFCDCYGMDSFKKNNLYLVDDHTFVYSSAISYHFFNFLTSESDTHFSKDGGGIGALAVHPTRQFYAVAEKGTWPNVYIYNRDHKLYRILQKGTERSYSNACFSKDGKKFATVGSSPDYQISIWDWKQENILLKAKAFSQEVYKINFSEYNQNILATSGMGHIKFWKVAETFTGLKLKGEIAKFGQVELSDVYAFYVFPDGKVLSGTEYGRLILWEGNVIKLVVGESEEEPCHNGSIEAIFLNGEYVISGGKDGYLKSWKLTELDQAEGDDHLNYYTKPHKSILIQENGVHAVIIQVTCGDQFWLVGDQKGKVWKVDWETGFTEILMASNSGPLTDLQLSADMNAAITTGDDGFVRLWDYVSQKEFYQRGFGARATSIAWMPFSQKNKGRIVVVGFQNGIVRFLLLNQEGFRLIKALKVHPNPIQQIKISSNTEMIAILSTAGEIFFLKYSDNIEEYTPFYLWETKKQINDMVFNKNGNKLLMAAKDGYLYESSIPGAFDNSESYLANFNPISYLVRMMESQKPKKEDMDIQALMRMKEDKMPDVEWEPASILNVAYNGDKVICSADGKYLGCIYIIDFARDRPIDMIPVQKVQTCSLTYFDDILLLGYRNGQFEIRHKSDFSKPFSRQSHDMDYGRVRKVALNYDRSGIVSIADDGTMYVHQLDFQGFMAQLNGNEIQDFTFAEFQNGINSASFVDQIGDLQEEEDIIDDKIYSIQQAKILAEEDNKRNEANKKKETVKQRIVKLREQFLQLRASNSSMDDLTKLTEDELVVDPEYKAMLLARVEEDLEETRKELEWDQYYAQLKAQKVKIFIDELEIDKFVVKGLKNQCAVGSFKVRKLSQFIINQLKETYRLIEEERKNIEAAPQEQKLNEMQQSQVKVVEQKNEEKKNVEGIQQQQQGEGKLSQAKAERERQRQEEERIRKEQDLLEKTKPTKEAFEPDHLKDIEVAKQTLGDYKLKSSKDFIVPDNQRMNVSKKRKHMYMLEEFIYKAKLKFNQNLLDLKQRKQNIVDKIKKYNQQINKINQQLNKQEQLFQPEIDKELEDPHSFMDITDEQIAEYANKGTQQKKDDQGKRIAPAQATKPQDAGQVKTRKGIKIQQSQLEDEMKNIQEMILLAEKQRMVDEMNEEIIQFDKDILECQKEKNLLESDMLIAKMKLVTFYQELIILDEMEDYDNKLIKEVLDFKKEKQDLDNTNDELIKSIQLCQKKEQQNEKEFNEQMKFWKELVHPDDEEKREKLHQYYLKKFRREELKRKNKEQNADNESGEDDEDEENEEEDEYASDDEEEKPDTNQVENDAKIKEIIEKICELEVQQEQNKKEKQDKERQKTQNNNKINNVMKDLHRANEDLRAYQKKKLQRVNQLDVSYVLLLSQIQNIVKETKQLPQDLQNSILFTQTEFEKLCKRIDQLKDEQKEINKNKNRMEKSKKILEKEIKIKNTKIDDLNKKYEEKHMLKFGEIIDLKLLDALEPTKQVLDQRQQFIQEEKECLRKVARAKEELSKVKQQLLEVKRENTKIFNNITKLGRTQMELSKKLTSGNKQLFKGENKQKKSDLENDKQNLEDLVKYLTKEIDELKSEIGQYKRKGGHIYTNVTATKQNFAQR